MIAKMLRPLILLLTSFLLGDVKAFSDANYHLYNQDYQACVRLFPLWHGPPEQTTPSPYLVNVSDVTYSPGGTITVTIYSTDGTSFKGFLIQARTLDTGDKVGEFINIPTGTRQNCEENYEGKTVTHSTPAAKTIVKMDWVAPNPGVGTVHFLFTVVKAGLTFWVNETSIDITQGSVTAPPMSTTPTMSTTPSTTRAPITSGPILEIDLSECGSSKSCYRNPVGCTSCEYTVTWRISGDNTVDIELQATIPDDEYYMALGLSTDDLMSFDSVIDCIQSSTTGPTVQMSYNANYMNTLLTNPDLGLVPGSKQVYFANGQLICRLTRYITVKNETSRSSAATLKTLGDGPGYISGHPLGALRAASSFVDEEKVFDLNGEYYLLVAIGPMISGMKQFHEVKTVSASQVNMTSGEHINIGGVTSYPLVKAHGILMVLAWLISASFAILMPRHFKKAWPGKLWCGKQIWFMIHMPLMVSTLFLTVAGFIIIFVSVGGYVQYPDYPEKIHPPMGLVTTALVIINPIMAYFRPHPGASKRPIFNIFHFAVGEAAHICAVTTIFLAVYMEKAGIPDWGVWVMTTFIIWHLLIEVILVVHDRCAISKSYNEYDINAATKEKADVTLPRSMSVAKTILVGVHLCGVIALGVTMIVAITLD